MIQFHNCKIVGDGVDHDIYAMQPRGERRGELAYVMSRGELMTFAECPVKWLQGVENDDTKSTDWGDLIDSLLLSPAKAEMKFAVAPAEYEPGKPWNYNAKKCKEWREDKIAAGMTVTTETEMKKATTALVALQRNKDIMELVECSKTQVMATGEYHDGATGLKIAVKVLLDLVPDKHHPRFGKSLADFKTTKNAAMFEFGRDINNHNYDAQEGLYLPVYVGATGEDRVDWQLAIQESSEPFHPEIYTMSTAFMENGEMKILKALKLYCWCHKNNTWPGYSLTARTKYNGIAICEPEDWMVKRLAEFCPIPTDQTEAAEIGDDNDLPTP
jgi:hypothetical protein